MPKPSSPSLAYVIQDYGQRLLRSVNKVIPSTVESYDPDSKTCTVRPGVYRLVPNEYEPGVDEVEELPAVHSVPVMWPRGRNFVIHGTLAKGDPVLLLCSDREFSAWQRTARPSAPMDGRLHSLANAIALPGLDTTPGTFPEPADAAALASKVKDELDELRTRLNAFIDKYDVHTHTDPVSGSTGVPSNAETTTKKDAIQDVKSTLLKLDS